MREVRCSSCAYEFLCAADESTSWPVCWCEGIFLVADEALEGDFERDKECVCPLCFIRRVPFPGKKKEAVISALNIDRIMRGVPNLEGDTSA